MCTGPSMKLTISGTYQSHHNAATYTCKAFDFQVQFQCKTVAQGKSEEYSTVDRERT